MKRRPARADIIALLLETFMAILHSLNHRIYISVKSLEYIATCFDSHLGHLQASILHKIIYNFMFNLYHSFATTVSQLKICDFSGETSKGFEVL